MARQLKFVSLNFFVNLSGTFQPERGVMCLSCAVISNYLQFYVLLPLLFFNLLSVNLLIPSRLFRASNILRVVATAPAACSACSLCCGALSYAIAALLM